MFKELRMILRSLIKREWYPVGNGGVRIENMKNVNRCVCCGEIIPEGTMVCKNCRKGGKEE